MEYTAALEGLRSLPPSSRVCIVTDSRLMLDSMTKWIHGWRRRGWSGWCRGWATTCWPRECSHPSGWARE
jgi:ribonuclease HI